MAPRAAKSTNMDVFVPMWLMIQERREINVMVLVGKSEGNAKTLLGDIQAELQYNQRYIHDFGEQYNAGSWEEGEFVTRSEVAFLPVAVVSLHVVCATARTVRTTSLLTTSTMTNWWKARHVSTNYLAGYARPCSERSTADVAASSWWATSLPKIRYWPSGAKLNRYMLPA